MLKKFKEKQKVLQNYESKDAENIYEYKVHLYIYDLAAIDEDKRKFPQLQTMKGYHLHDTNEYHLNVDCNLASPQEKLRRAAQGEDNLTIEPLSSIELANFYGIEPENNGLMFHKNLCDSFIINEEQGSIYFLMQEKKKDLYRNQDNNTIKYVLKRLEYNQMQLSKPDDVFTNNNNHSLKSDLDELRNLKYKVLTFGTNELHIEPLNFYD